MADALASPPPLRIACAGWSLPRETWPRFASEGSHLQRYATVFDATEINSSFYRPHQPKTYARWAEGTPATFRFSVKVPKAVTHERALVDCAAPLETFLAQAGALGDRLGCLLLQLAPSLAFDAPVVESFLGLLRQLHAGPVALEPRHRSWFGADADALLVRHRIARVLADPVLHPEGVAPGGWPGLVYCRLHGSPRTYYSAYAPETLAALAARLRKAREDGAECWCVFDNTAAGQAVPDALALLSQLGSTP